MAGSGRITFSTGGASSETVGPNIPVKNVMIQGHPANTTNVYVVRLGDAFTDAYPLVASQQLPQQVMNMNQLVFFSDTNLNEVCWIKINL
jgi:hypothetical protein